VAFSIPLGGIIDRCDSLKEGILSLQATDSRENVTTKGRSETVLDLWIPAMHASVTTACGDIAAWPHTFGTHTRTDRQLGLVVATVFGAAAMYGITSHFRSQHLAHRIQDLDNRMSHVESSVNELIRWSRWTTDWLEQLVNYQSFRTGTLELSMITNNLSRGFAHLVSTQRVSADLLPPAFA
jgi:hypothetical protein